MKNRHIVDELGDLREQKKALEKREKQLRQEIVEQMDGQGGDSLGGDQYIVRRKMVTRRGAVDTKRMMIEKSIDPDDYRKPDTQTMQLDIEERAYG